MDLYEILNIKTNATKADIRKAYYNLAKKYHPDKNNNNDEDFKRINSAYQILINDTSRLEYLKLNHQDKNNFSSLYDRIINNKLNISDFIKYGINITNIDLEYIKNNFINFFKNLNIQELLELYSTGKFKKKNYEPMDCSDVDETLYTETCGEYLYILPIGLETSVLDININLNIKLVDIINSKKQITIKRNINNKNISSTFIFNITHPYIIYYGAGDSDNSFGNLIIKLNLPQNYTWDENLILIEQSMSLYEMIYGLNIKINININNNIEIPNWVPSRDGLYIDLIKYKNELKINNYNIGIKLCLDYDTNDEKELLLKKYFS